MRRTLAAVVCFVGLIALWSLGQRSPAAADKADAMKGAKYIGVASCKKCHFKQYLSWKKSKHAHAWKVLPDKYRDPSEKDKDGRECISCHVTGWGHGDIGGFKNIKDTKDMVDVQCEDCHGPGSKHKAAAEKLLAETPPRMKFKAGEETYIVLKTTKCVDCHNPHVSHAKYLK